VFGINIGAQQTISLDLDRFAGMNLVPKLLRLDSRVRRTAEARLPDWATDFVELVKIESVSMSEVVDLPKFLLTFAYSILCPRHFYLRLGVILHREFPAKRIPSLQRPFPYLVSLFFFLNICAYFYRHGLIKLSLLGFLPKEEAQFNLAVFSLVLLFPLFAVLVFVLNSQRHFWQPSRFRYKEFVPGVIYYCVNSVVLIPVAYYSIVMGATLIYWPMTHWGLPILGLAPLLFVSASAVNYCITKPILHLVLFRSQNPYLKRGAEMSIMGFQECIDYAKLAMSRAKEKDTTLRQAKSNSIFPNVLFEESAEEEAVFKLSTSLAKPKRPVEIDPLPVIDSGKLGKAERRLANESIKLAKAPGDSKRTKRL
jgi:hypothetical protein